MKPQTWAILSYIWDALSHRANIKVCILEDCPGLLEMRGVKSLSIIHPPISGVKSRARHIVDASQMLASMFSCPPPEGGMWREWFEQVTTWTQSVRSIGSGDISFFDSHILFLLSAMILLHSCARYWNLHTVECLWGRLCSDDVHGCYALWISAGFGQWRTAPEN